jgi:hypothetical protein
MWYTYFITAFILGAAGSLHCIGMCGPIALSMPVWNGQSPAKSFSIIAYFLGKTLSYGLLGLLFGWLGQQLFMAGFQQVLSMALGLCMLVFSIATLWKPVIFHQNKLTQRIGDLLSPWMGRFIGSRKPYASLVLGGLNGFLPCGLVYTSLSAAMATGDAFIAAAFMMVFGLATMPLMLFFLLFTNQLGFRYRMAVRKSLPYFTALVAMLLIVRGLGLGIPYISPNVGAQVIEAGQAIPEAASCH